MRCSLPRPKWRTTGRVWVTHRRTLLGWITRTDSSAATRIAVGLKRPARRESQRIGLLGFPLEVAMAHRSRCGQFAFDTGVECPNSGVREGPCVRSAVSTRLTSHPLELPAVADPSATTDDALVASYPVVSQYTVRSKAGTMSVMAISPRVNRPNSP